MADNDDSKTEMPTDKRLSDAVERGQFAKSPELQVVAMLAAALGIFSLTINASARDVASLATLLWGNLGAARVELATVPQQLGEVGLLLGRILGPVVFITAIAAAVAGGIQTGFRVSPKALGFKFERLDVMAGFQRIFSKAAAVHGLVDFFKIICIGFVLWVSARSLLADPMFSTPIEVGYLGDFLRRATLEFFGKLLMALGIIAAISYSYEKYRNLQEMKMSHQEVKDEHKQSEGDGFTKGAMRRMARRLLQKQMLTAVPTADVIVTNPTHYAVALKYERGKDSAPIVLAKGENRFALRIKALAAEHGVPIVENKPVARMLYGLGKVGESIPADLYQVVAEILAFVYRSHRLYFHDLKIRRAAAEGAIRRSA